MKRRILAMLVSLVMLVGLLPTAMLADDPVASGTTAIDASQTLSGSVGALTVTGGTKAEPVVLTVDGTVLVNGKITISSGYVTILGDGDDTLKRNFNTDDMIAVLGDANLTVEQLTLDGGAIWNGTENELLNRGTENKGVKSVILRVDGEGNPILSDKGELQYDSFAMIKHHGAVTIDHCVMQNHDGNQAVFAEDVNTANLTVNASRFVNNNGGILWTRRTVQLTNTEFAYNMGNPSVIRGATGTQLHIYGGDIHHNYNPNGIGTIYTYNSNITLYSGAKIRDNYVVGNGGAIYISNYTLRIYHAEITNNTATGEGGAFYLDKAGLILDNGTNYANGYDEGGIGAVISGNTAGEKGAIYASWKSPLTLLMGSITNNQATNGVHGGVFSSDSVFLNGTEIQDNIGTNFYLNSNNTHSIGSKAKDVYLSWGEEIDSGLSKYGTVNLETVVDKVHYDDTNADDDMTMLPFVASDGSKILFAKGILNGGYDVEFPEEVGVNTLPNAIKTHSCFVGWFTDEDCTDDSKVDENTVLQAGATYYAKYAESGYVKLGEETLNPTFEMFYEGALPASKTATFVYNPADQEVGGDAEVTIRNIEGNAHAFDVELVGQDTIRITPKANMPVGTYRAKIHVRGHDTSLHSITATLTVKEIELVLTPDEEIAEAKSALNEESADAKAEIGTLSSLSAERRDALAAEIDAILVDALAAIEAATTADEVEAAKTAAITAIRACIDAADKENADERFKDSLHWAVRMLYMQEYTIKATASEGGTITSNGNGRVKFDKSLTYTITPDEGYEIVSVIVDGRDIGAVSEYTFARVKEAHSISAVFAPRA